MSARERAKGIAFEREIATRFREALGVDARRGAQTRSGSDASDVEGIPRFWVECKHRKALAVEAALRQAQGSCSGARWPIAVLKRDRAQPFVAMALDDFLALLSGAQPKGTP